MKDLLKGLLIVQGANVCFAAGQVGYNVIIEKERQSYRPNWHCFLSLVFLSGWP